MSVVDGGPDVSGIIARVQGILMKPREEFAKIDTENPTVQQLFVGYAAPLAAIPALAQMVAGFFPRCFMNVCVNTNPIFAVVGGVVNYALGLAMVYVGALVVDALAPSFGGTPNRTKALQLVVYGWTAAWLAGIFAIFGALGPLAILGILGILGLYSLYLLYVGIPILMKAPADKALVYTIVVIIAMIILYIIVGGVSGYVMRMGAPNAVGVHIGQLMQGALRA